jgi:hypothetical protein
VRLLDPLHRRGGSLVRYSDRTLEIPGYPPMTPQERMGHRDVATQRYADYTPSLEHEKASWSLVSPAARKGTHCHPSN